MTRAKGRAMGRVKARLSPNIQINMLRAHLIGRYRLDHVPGRPEELRQPGTTHGVSVQYGCKQIRVRLMDGRQWVETLDLQLDGTHTARVRRVVSILDPWFGRPTPTGVPIDAETYGQREAREARATPTQETKP